MLNIFMGFEQANRYSISLSMHSPQPVSHLTWIHSFVRLCLGNEAGEHLGYIAEEPRGLLSMFSRQIFRTHRPFRAVIMDVEGSPILWVRRRSINTV
jgi:hypothetical protein